MIVDSVIPPRLGGLFTPLPRGAILRHGIFQYCAAKGANPDESRACPASLGPSAIPPLSFHPPGATMTIYALYIYNRSVPPLSSILLHLTCPGKRHCECIYYHDWHQSRVLQPPREGATHRRNVARYGDLSTLTGDAPEAPKGKRTKEGKTTVDGLPFDEQAKLVYGVLLSLRNMCKKLSGRCVLSPLFLLSFPFPRSCVLTLAPLTDRTNNSPRTAHQPTNSTSTQRRPTSRSSCSPIRSRIHSGAC